jgi:hypothetical protein
VQPLPAASPAPRRALLGPADVTDDELAAFAAAGLGVRHATVLTSTATVFPYDRPAITTAGRYLVTGTARTGAGQVRVGPVTTAMDGPVAIAAWTGFRSPAGSGGG